MTQLKDEREILSKEVNQLRQSVDQLNRDIALLQSQLPSAGSAPNPDTRPDSSLQVLFDNHVSACTMQNWKYWVFSLVMQPLLDSYDRWARH